MCKFLTDLFKKTDKPLENVIVDEKPEAIEETIEEEYNNENEDVLFEYEDDETRTLCTIIQW